jgi:hypothetical protein
MQTELEENESQQDKINDAHVIDCGKLSNKKWPGGVSAKGVANEKLDTAIERLNEFYVPVNPKAKTRCIDGRHDPELNEDNLGPQVPGGAPGAALAWRLGVDEGSIEAATFLLDAERMIDEFERRGFAPGGHRDEYSIGNEHAAGCGAIDGMDKVIDAMMRHLDDHKRLVRTLLGNSEFNEYGFNKHIYREMLGGAALVNFESKRYFAGREKIIDSLEKRHPNSIATLVGAHKEALVVVNLVPNTTLASNRFAEEFGGMQAFGYDLWRSLEMAKSLIPRDEDERLRHNFVTARVMTSVATLMALTDGTQRLALRTPALESL